jgi:hypothetical protein
LTKELKTYIEENWIATGRRLKLHTYLSPVQKTIPNASKILMLDLKLSKLPHTGKQQKHLTM